MNRSTIPPLEVRRRLRQVRHFAQRVMFKLQLKLTGIQMKDLLTTASARNEHPSGGLEMSTATVLQKPKIVSGAATISAPKAAKFFYLPCRNRPSSPVTHIEAD